MVMATGNLCLQYDNVELPHEEAVVEAGTLHERLVAYVHALAPAHDARCGVWVEHSYARPRGPQPAPHVRELLAPPRRTVPPGPLDVTRCDPRPAPPDSPPPPASPPHCSPDHHEDEWEAHVTTLAPSAAHAQLADSAVETLRALRLARLAGGYRPEHAAARRLRRALLAALTARGGGAHALPWLHGALTAHAPRPVRRLYDEVLAELARAAPRLAERVLGGAAPPPRRPRSDAVGEPVGADGSPWLLWLSGDARRDRWRRRLGALVHTRAVPVPEPASAVPDAWCAAQATAARTALEDALAEAGERVVVVGGAGRCAALAAALCAAGVGEGAGAGAGVGAGARVRGVLLLALAPRTAEGPRAAPDDVLGEVRAPLLLVAGERGAAPLAAAPARRLLLVRGADHALRLPARATQRLRLEQRALDAAIADECARWVLQVGEGTEVPPPAPAPRGTRRRPPLTDDQLDDYAHLPTALVRHDKLMEDVGEGRVVSRGAGGVPLPLPPPRRTAPPTPAPPAPLAAADIMRLPIVFADDEGVPAAPVPASPSEPDDSAVTVTSGGAAWRGPAPYTRVIVASRGARGGGGDAGRRPLLLRRTVRIVPRT